jgi:hypothetical protein
MPGAASSKERGMFTRRSLLSGGFFAATTPPSTTADDSHLLIQIRDELRALRPTCELPRCAEVDQIRAQQRTFLRARHKLPDFIDVGIDIWERAYEWLVSTRQPAEITRLPEGRNGLRFMTTMLVMRPDASGGFVGFGYDRQ